MQVSPQRILSTLQAYRDAAALHTAIELDLFTRIAHSANTVSGLAAELGIPARGLGVLCDYLAGAGLLDKNDDELRLAEDAAMFLDQLSPGFLGGAAGVLYCAPLLCGFERLTAAVRAGAAPDAGGTTGAGRPPWFDLARGVTDPTGATQAFAEALVFPEGQKMKILDLGAGDGAFGIALAQKYPEAIVVALDSPEALEVAQRQAAAANLGTRYQNIPGDPLIAPLGSEYDLVLIAGNLYRFDAAQITSLLMRIHYALKKTGQLAILEFLIEEGAEFRREYAGFRLNMLAATARGDAYCWPDLKGMLESAGFKPAASQSLPAARLTLVTARP